MALSSPGMPSLAAAGLLQASYALADPIFLAYSGILLCQLH